MIHIKHARSLSGLSLTLFLLSACGPSQAQYDALNSKYEKLASENQAEQDAHAASRAELDATKHRVETLKRELKKMGVNLDTLSSHLQQAGTEKEQLAQSLEELQAALEEYKARAAQLEKIKARFEALQKKLQSLTNLGLKVEIRHNRMIINLPGDVLYASGSDKLKDQGKEVVLAVADVIRKDDQLKKRYFQIAGHTDNKPLKGGRFGDNWGLSAMRAREVLLLLVASESEKGGGLNSALLHVAGYGDSDPVADNGTEEGRGLNRRVELVLLPDVEEMLDLKNM